MTTENTQDLTDIIEVEYSLVQFAKDTKDTLQKVIGKPFRIGSTGKVYNSFTGKPYVDRRTGAPLPEITLQDMQDAINIFKSGRVIHLNRDHNKEEPLGRVADLYLTEEEGTTFLNCVPLYTEAGIEYVAPKKGELFSSPGYAWRKYYDPREDNKLLGSFLLDHVALTVTPAQHHSVLSEVSLSTTTTEATSLHDLPGEETVGENTMEEMTPEEMKAVLDENAMLKQKVDELAASMEKLLEENALLKQKMEENASENVEDMEADMQLSEKLAQMEHNLSEITKELEASRQKELLLSEEVATHKNKAYNAQKERVIEALFSAGKVAEAEREAVVMAYDAQYRDGGAKLFDVIYGKRLPNSVVPAPMGHGEPAAEVELSLDPRDRAVNEYMRQHPGVDVVVATQKVAAQNPALFMSAK